jgi:hypothetical protein
MKTFEAQVRRADGQEEEPQVELFQIRSSWPEPLNRLAYQGLAGEIARTVEPHTESDPIAILAQSLIVFGNIIGRGPHFRVEADRHYTNENSVIVGETSKGRKGTSDGIVLSLFALMSHAFSQQWASERVKSGLSSGEGVTYHVRDATDKEEGVSDKRLFVRETEFGSVLRVLERQGNTLSPVIRQAWDSGNLAILTKNNPLKATNAHISISGHITAAELKHYLYDVEIFNGLANRFLWFCVKRSKVLPEGGRFHELDMSGLKGKIQNAIEFARSVGEVRRDDGAREIWIQTYPDLSEGKPGMSGSVLSRAEAHVMRLAVIYSLMDLSCTIRREHLLAALALWEYAEASVKFIFGDRMGDAVADRIYDALGDSSEGLTRTEIRDMFDRHEKRERIDDAITLLVRYRKVVLVKEETGGRPTERIKRTQAQATKAI